MPNADAETCSTSVAGEARHAGLRRADLSLFDIERRRIEIWVLVGLVVSAAAALCVGVSAVSSGPLAAASPNLLRGGIGLLALAFVGYAVEKERHLRRLQHLLIRERVRRELTESRMRELVAVDQARNELLETVSHDLRGPLTTIIGAASTSRRLGPDHPDFDNLLAAVERQGRRLDRLVGQLLVAARAEAGAGSGHERVDLTHLAARTARDFEATAGEVVLHLDGPAIVEADSEALEQVLWNLLDNAAKHGSAPIRVTVGRGPDGGVGARGDDAGEEWVALSVTDAGPGVAAAERERVFERFVSTLSGGVAAGSGFGLGLPIVKRIVEALDGRVWIDDGPDGGSSFEVRLPAAPASSTATVESAGTSATATDTPRGEGDHAERASGTLSPQSLV